MANDYSLENKARILKEVGYFPTNNFCNGRELKDLSSLKEMGLNPVLKDGYMVQQRDAKEKLDFFMLGAYISKYTSLIYDIAMFYLAVEKENKGEQIDYTFKEYIQKNLRDTTWEYQRLIKHKDIDVKLYNYETIYTTVTEKSFFTQYLNFDNINEYKLEVIEEKVQEEINKYYDDFNISELFEQRSEYYSFLDYNFNFDFNDENHRNVLRCDFIIENLKYKNGFYYDLEEENFKEGKYYFYFSEYEEEVPIDINIPLSQSLIDFGISEDKVKTFFKEERDSLNIIKEKINDIVKENNDLSPTYQVQEEEVETPLYSQQEIVEYINNNEIWDREFLAKFYSELSNEEIVDLLDYYNHRIWNDYNKTGEEYYYYYFDKNLTRQRY